MMQASDMLHPACCYQKLTGHLDDAELLSSPRLTPNHGDAGGFAAAAERQARKLLV